MSAFCLDTSAFIDLWVRRYPQDVFPSLWVRIEELIREDVLLSPDEVLVELERKEGELYAWAKKRKKMFRPLTEDVQKGAQDVLRMFPKLVDSRRKKGDADPFVISLAQITRTVVVTDERGGTVERPRMPFVCQHLGIEFTDALGMIRRLGWSF